MARQATADADDSVREFVDASLAYLVACDQMRTERLPNAPSEMVDPTIPETADGVGWKPIASTVTDADLDALERTIGLSYPPLYRAFLKYKHFYQLLGPIEFFPHPIHAWSIFLGQVYRNDLTPEGIVGAGLIPFGDEVLHDAGLMCFDTRRADAEGDCPVVLFGSVGGSVSAPTGPVFSSTRKMFECLRFEVEQDIPFMLLKDTDSTVRIARKRELMRGFVGIDPDGAGGPGRAYWTAGGIEPDLVH